MLKQLLQNKLVLLGVVAMIIVAIIVVPYLISRWNEPGTEEGESFIEMELVPCDSMATPIFCDFQAQITKFGEEKWSSSSFALIKHDIDQFAAKDDLLSSEEAAQLHQYLQSKYLRVLSDSVQEFAKYGNSWKEMKMLQEALNNYEEKNRILAQEILDNYKNAWSLSNRINKYAIGQRHDQKQYNRYYEEIKGFQTTEFIGENSHLQKRIKTTVNQLNIHREHDHRYKKESLKEECSCEEKFEGYNYYVEQCDSIQRANQYQDTTKVN